MFSGCTVPPNSKETELGSSDQEASLSTGKNIRIILVPCSRMVVAMLAHGSASLQLFPVLWIFLRSLDVICYNR